MKIPIVLFSCISVAICQVVNPCRVSLQPSIFIGVVGFNGYFLCQGYNAEDGIAVNWFINDTLYENGNIGNVNVQSTSSGLAHFLQIVEAPEYFNNTIITCSVRSSNIECNSTESVLLLQGNLAEVPEVDVQLNFDCIANGSVDVSWKSPFTLDISEVEDDIEYLIDIKLVTSNRTTSKMTTDTTFTAILPDSNPENASCISFEITITPSNDFGHGNSTATIKTPTEGRTVNIEVIGGAYVESDNIMYTLHAYPAVCGVKITLTDTYSNEVSILNDSNIQVYSDCYNVSIILLNSLNANLTKHRYYNASYLLTNTGGNTTCNIISTHDIQQLNIDAKAVLTVVFLANTTAMGVLVLFRSSNFDPVFKTLSIEKAQQYKIPSTMSGRSIFLFDIDENGYLLEGINYPATEPKEFPGLSSYFGNTSRDFNNCSLKSPTEDTISILCHCSSFTGYQAIVLLQNEPSGRIYVGNGNCSIPVEFNVENNGLYSIVAFAIEGNSGITGSEMHYAGNITIGGGGDETTSEIVTDRTNISAGAIIGVSIVCLVMLIILLIIILTGFIISYMHRKKKVSKSNFSKKKSLERSTSSVKYLVDEEGSINYETGYTRAEFIN